MRGVYIAYVGQGQLPTLEELSKPYVSGVVFVRNWDLVEPINGQFDWRDFDQTLATVQQAGKRAMLGIKHSLAEAGLPAWRTFPTFTDRLGNTFPLLWDAGFQSEFINANCWLISRYKDHPAVDGFVASGFYSQRFAEMGLAPGVTGTCLQQYIQSGYTRQRVQEAALNLLRQFFKRTAKTIRLAINPLLCELTKERTMQNTEAYVLQPLEALCGAQIVIGKTNLMPSTPPATDTIDPYYAPLRARPRVFWQVDIVANGGPSTPDEWQAAMDVSMTYGTQWTEVRRDDVVRDDLANILTAWNTAMHA